MPDAERRAHTANLTILDGGLGSEIELRGFDVPRAPWWSAHCLRACPEAVARVHADYAAAGATVHTTNTFRTKRCNIGEPWEELTRLAYQLCREAVPRSHRVAGSIAPVGHCYQRTSPAAAARVSHGEMARLLSELGVDLLLCETFAALDEAYVAIEECRATGTETWAAFTAGPNGDLLAPREFADAAWRAVDQGVSCVMINCTPAVSVLPFLEAIGRLPCARGAYANAGRQEDGMGWSEDERSTRRYAEEAKRWVDAGATVIGGCCGVRPAHVRALAREFGHAAGKE